MQAKKRIMDRNFKVFLLLVAFLFWPGLYSYAGQVLVDCVLAMVKEKPVTLFDWKIVKSFNLISESQEGIYEGQNEFLEAYVDQILILELAREQIKIEEEEIKQEIIKSRTKIGPENFDQKLLKLGLSEQDLRPYIQGKLLFDKVIGSRFSQTSYVSLKEIEEYYQNEYVPQQKARGQTPAELFQVLDELERKLQRNKRKKEIKGWMEELRQRADIIINQDCLKKTEIQEEK